MNVSDEQIIELARSLATIILNGGIFNEDTIQDCTGKENP